MVCYMAFELQGMMNFAAEFKKPDLSEAHRQLGHMSFQKTKQIAKQLGWLLTGSNEVCKACAEGKA
jgi:GAG-pre-integrase domain